MPHAAKERGLQTEPSQHPDGQDVESQAESNSATNISVAPALDIAPSPKLTVP